MKKAMLVLLAAVLVTAGVGLATCSVDGFEGLSAAAPDVPVGDPGTGTDLGTVEIPGEVSFPAGSVEGTVSFAVPFEAAQGSGAAQSVSGAGLADIKSVGRGVRNIYQLIAVDDSVPDAVSGFDEIRTSGALSADIVKGHTYHFLVLGGHVEKADPVGPGNQPTLLVSGYVSKTMSTEAGSSRFSLTMTPLVVDAAFVKNGASGEVRQSGRLAKTVGLDEKTGYTFRVVLGSDEAGVLGPDDALRTATGNGITPLVQAEAGVKGGAGYWGDLSLLSNAAQFNDEALADYNDANRTDLSKPHTTRGTAEYMLTTPPTGAATTASFKMEYAPFGLADAAWADSGSAKPVWVIRNGLNGNPQDANTDFAAYNGITDTGKNPNGALNVAVVNPTAARGAGLYEGNNPAPVEGVDTSGEGGLVNALDALNDKGDAAKYGDYTVRLDTAPDDLAPITLGGGDYADIKDIDLVIEGPTDAPIKLPPESGLFPPVPDSGVTVEYGDGVTTVDPFTVTYKTNNGSEDVHHTDTVAFPATSVGSLPSDPAWAGHDFTGWKDGGGAEFTDQTTVSADIEVYAQWEVFSTVTYKMNDGTEAVHDTAKVKDPANTVGTLPADPAWAGHVFLGWTINQDGSGGAFTAATEVTGDIDVYAQWEEAFTVTYKLNDGTEAVYATKVVKSPDTTVVALPANPVHAGWGFLGWNTKQDGSGGAFIATTTVTGDITVWAQWKSDYALGGLGPGGGLIFYDNPNYGNAGWRYLELAPDNTHTSLKWAPNNTTVVSGTSSAIGTGKENTAKIIAAYSAATTANCAATYCVSLTSGGKNDWFLPSSEELNAIYDVCKWSNTSWSSTELTKNSASMLQNYDALGTAQRVGENQKSVSMAVRAMRRF